MLRISGENGMIWRYQDVKWNSVNAMVDRLPAPLNSISWRRRARLYVRLCRARRDYDLRKAADDEPTLKNMAKRLEGLENSLKIIDDFWKEQACDKVSGNAFVIVHLRAKVWASETFADKEDRQLPLGFKRSYRLLDDENPHLGNEVDFGSSRFLNGFFEGAAFVRQILKETVGYLRTAPNEDLFNETAERWLIGRELPRIYSEAFGRQLAIDPSAGASKKHAGNAFALNALKVLRLDRPNDGGDWSLATLRTHLRQSKAG